MATVDLVHCALYMFQIVVNVVADSCHWWITSWI